MDPRSVHAENMRFYGDMRFKQLTLLLAAMTAAGGGVISKEGMNYRWWIALGALCLTGMMWVMEVRSSLHGIEAGRLAGEFWPGLGGKVFLPRLNATLVVALLHLGFYAFWLGCMYVWHPRLCGTFAVGLVVGIFLTFYTGANYWRVRGWWVERRDSPLAITR